MAVFSKEFADEALKKLKEKGALEECSRCGHTEFQLLEGFIAPPIFLNTKSTVSKSIMPSLVLFCKNCAFTSIHNLGLLNLSKWGDPLDENK